MNTPSVTVDVIEPQNSASPHDTGAGGDSLKNTAQKNARRRNIDPTTCERDYSYDEIEFMQALDEYKRQAKRMFPTCSEILEVLRKLGYTKDLALTES